MNCLELKMTAEKKKKKQKSTFRIYLEYIPFFCVYHLLNLIPLKIAYRITTFMFIFVFWLDGRHRKRAISHLLHAKVAKNPAEARKMALRSYQEFAKLLVEIVHMGRLYSPERIRVVGTPAGVAFLTPPHEPGTGQAIVVTAHYGNWEVAGTAFSDYSQIRMLSLMRPFANPKIGELILRNRRSNVHELLDKNVGLRPAIKALREGRHVTILIDQHASSAEGVETVFFGQPCRTHKTPALLHLKTGVPILPELTRRCGDFEFELVLGDPIRYTPTEDKEHDVQVITQMCTTALEKMIAEQPEQWLWAARRWLNINRKTRNENASSVGSES